MRISDWSSDVCSSDLTVNFLERLHVLSERYVRKHLEPLGRDERANEEHRQMLDAWLARDSDRLRALTVAHIQKTLEIGRASCRERVCQHGSISVVAVVVKKKKQ